MTTKHKLAQLHGKKGNRQVKPNVKPVPQARPAVESPRTPSTVVERLLLAVGVTLVVASCMWAYWPTLQRVVSAWERIADYSHGYLVVPLAIYFAWHRRKLAPPWAAGFYWPGVVLIVGSIVVRIAGARFYLDALDGWSIPIFVGGVVWLLFGRESFVFTLPSIAFLFFAIPLPYRAETLLSVPLQKISTRISCWTLQSIGQPVLAEGNVILLNDSTFEVAQACSGLRILVAVAALAFAYIVLVPRPWWQKLMIALCIAPIAIIANSTRVVITVLLHEFGSEALSHQFSHDLAGWVMIPYAAMLFGMLLIYMGWLVREVPVVAPATLLRRQERSET